MYVTLDHKTSHKAHGRNGDNENICYENEW